MSTETARGGRFVTQKDLTTDYTLTITNVDDGALRISNNLKDINLIDDIGGGALRKVDQWDSLPDLTSMATAVARGYLGRAVLYTGDTYQSGNQLIQTGCVYKCIPAAAYTWTKLFDGASAQIMKCEDLVKTTDIKDNDGVVIPIGVGDYMSIITSDGNARCIFYYDQDATYGGTIKMATGCKTIAEAEAATNKVIVYRLLLNTNWTRTDELNEYTSLFSGCTVEHIALSISHLFKGHIDSASDPVPALYWELITNDEPVAISPYETVYPINNTCYLTTSPTCFDFGTIPSTSDSLEITLDMTSFAIKQYYNNNVIYLETSKAISLVISAVKGSLTKDVTVLGDSITGAGKYRITLEAMPDSSETLVATVTKIDTSSASDTSGSSAYGIRYNLDDADPSTNITRIEMTRSVDAEGNTVEVISERSSYTQMPCHKFKRCLVKNFSDGPSYYLFESDSRYKTDGTTPADLTGVDGDVAVEIPKTYLRITKPLGSGTSLSSGKIDYLISNTAIPDPPTGTVDAVIYNGVHPAFYVGGELDAAGGYETKYNPTTGVRETTSIPLRVPKDRLYIGAFASVRCHHGNIGITEKTLNATATSYEIDASYTNYKDPTGSFSDEVNYPKLQSGIASGIQVTDSSYAGFSGKVAATTNTEARSIAPYRDGDLLYVAMPGVDIIITSSDSDYPEYMPGGCNATFSGDKEGTYDYSLTTDTTFKSDKAYYTRSGSGTAADPYVYTKDTAVVVGEEIPANTYYNRRMVASTEFTYTWSNAYTLDDQSTVTRTFELKYNSTATSENYQRWVLTCKGNSSSSPASDTVIAKSEVVTTFSSFTGLSWEVVLPTGSEVIATCSSTDSIKRLYVGPANYGTHNASFVWNNQKYWDSAITGNPNWALNYRPIAGRDRAFFQLTHGNGYSTDADTGTDTPFYAYTLLSAELFDGVSSSMLNIPSSKAFQFAGTIAARSITCDPGNVWYGLDSTGHTTTTFSLTFDVTTQGWKYSAAATDSSNVATTAIMESDYLDKSDLFVATSDTTVDTTKTYFTRTGVGPDYTYTTVESSSITSTEPATFAYSTDTKAIIGKTYYTYNGSTYTAVTFQSETTLVTPTNDERYQSGKFYYLLNSTTGAYVIDTSAVVGNLIPATPARYDQVTYYERYSFYEANVKLPVNCEFINSDRRYLELYDPGYRPSFSINSSDSATALTSEYGIALDTWTCNDTVVSTNHLTKTYTYTKDNTTNRLAFDNSSLRWKIYRTESSEVKELYQTERLDPATYRWAGNSVVRTGELLPFYRMSFMNGTTATTSTLYWLPTVSKAEMVFTLEDAATAATPYARKWLHTADSGYKYRIEYIDASDTRAMSENGDRYVVTTDTIVKEGQSYYTRSGSAGSYVYTLEELSAGSALPSGVTHYNACYAFYLTPDTTVQSGKTYYIHNQEEAGAWKYSEPSVPPSISSAIPANTYYTNLVSDIYSGCWVVAEYESNGTTLRRIVASDMDLVMNVDNTRRGWMRPLNPQSRNDQRDSSTTAPKNNALVYQFEDVQSGSTVYLQAILINEKGLIPSYFDTKTELKAAITKFASSYAGRWILIKYATGDYTDLAQDTTQTDVKPYAWSETFTSAGPWSPNLAFTSIKGAVSGTVDVGNNDRVLRFKNKPLVAFKAKSSGRAFNMNIRTKEFLAMMMVIDYGTFDTFNTFSSGKLLARTAISEGRDPLYSTLTFSGRTVKLGNNSGTVLYDKDIDINIDEDDFDEDVDKVVAINWRGIENPYGNIAEFADGLLPMCRYINGVPVTGYYECIDPGAYTDVANATDGYKPLWFATTWDGYSWMSYAPAKTYFWTEYGITPSSGWINFIDPTTTLPYICNGSASNESYVASRFRQMVTSALLRSTTYSAYNKTAYYFIYNPSGSVAQHASMFSVAFDDIASNVAVIGARLQY